MYILPYAHSQNPYTFTTSDSAWPGWGSLFPTFEDMSFRHNRQPTVKQAIAHIPAPSSSGVTGALTRWFDQYLPDIQLHIPDQATRDVWSASYRQMVKSIEWTDAVLPTESLVGHDFLRDTPHWGKHGTALFFVIMAHKARCIISTHDHDEVKTTTRMAKGDVFVTAMDTRLITIQPDPHDTNADNSFRWGFTTGRTGRMLPKKNPMSD
jgi:hypothetical protein